MTTYLKFTDPGRESHYGTTDYPPVGEWSEDRVPVLCQSGWHLPHPDFLSNYLMAELWEVEVDGASVRGKDKSSHQRIKFLRKVLAWDSKAVVQFAQWCSERAKDAAATSDAAYAARAASYAARAATSAARAAAAYAAAAAAARADAARADAASYAARAAADAADAAAYAAAADATYASAAHAAAAAERKLQSDWIRDYLIQHTTETGN